MNRRIDFRRHGPNILSALRIIGALGLLFCKPAGAAFWAIYALCGISDMADGWLARKFHAETKVGAILDSVADLSFVVCCAIRLLPLLSIPSWLWIWAGIIVIIKIFNQVSAWAVFKRFCFPHTVANKLTGFLLFLAVPAIFWTVIPVAVVSAVATFAAIQEGRVLGDGKYVTNEQMNDKRFLKVIGK